MKLTLATIRTLANYFTVFSDVKSIKTARSMSRAQNIPAGGQTAELRIRALDGLAITCRYGTTDLDVVWDTFLKQYHCPPSGRGTIRSILDLGSNIGTTIAHFGVLYPEARIVGVELEASNFHLCQTNIRHFGDRCRVLQGAAWTTDGAVSIGGDTEWGFHAISSEGRQNTVRAYAMETLLRELGSDTVDYVKMDIEGAEKDILQNADNWIGRVRCMKIEIHDPYDVHSCMQDLRRYGFVCKPDSDHPRAVIAVRN